MCVPQVNTVTQSQDPQQMSQVDMATLPARLELGLQQQSRTGEPTEYSRFLRRQIVLKAWPTAALVVPIDIATMWYKHRLGCGESTRRLVLKYMTPPEGHTSPSGDSLVLGVVVLMEHVTMRMNVSMRPDVDLTRMLGKCFLKGEGTPQDLPSAVMLFEAIKDEPNCEDVVGWLNRYWMVDTFINYRQVEEDNI